MVHYFRPGDNPRCRQRGDRLVYLPGVYEHPLRKRQSLLFADKSMDIELMDGTVLKLADGKTSLEFEPEPTVDHGTVETLDKSSYDGRGSYGIRVAVERLVR